MIRPTTVWLTSYLEQDRIAEWLRSLPPLPGPIPVCERWLSESPPKRAIFDHLYGDLLESRDRRVLDIGGGLTRLTAVLAQRHDYHLVDCMAHENDQTIAAMRESMPGKIHQADWFEVSFDEPFDVVIANDLFPNVDQRLTLFLPKFLSLCGEMRLSLTYYPSPKFYRTRRTDGDEIMWMMAWNHTALRQVLESYARYIDSPDLSMLDLHEKSLFANGRQVVLTTLRGAAARRGDLSKGGR